MLSVHALVKEVKHMKTKLKVGGFFAVLGLLVLGALLVPAVSAGQTVGTVGSDLPALLSGQQNLTAVEFIVRGQDCSTIWGYRDATICTNAINDIEFGLTHAINEMKSHGVIVVEAIVTGEYEKNSISFGLNLTTGMFERLKKPVTDIVPGKSSVTLSNLVIAKPLLAGLSDSIGHGTPSGSSVAFWAHSVTNPTATFPIMSTTAELHKYNNYNWNSIPAQDGATLYYVPYNNRDPVATGLPSGLYRNEGQFSGVRDDYSNYEEHLIGTQFTIS
jgi:hypothetical protein